VRGIGRRLPGCRFYDRLDLAFGNPRRAFWPRSILLNSRKAIVDVATTPTRHRDAHDSQTAPISLDKDAGDHIVSLIICDAPHWRHGRRRRGVSP